MNSPAFAGPSRALFIATILVGSFLLFLVQPMVARMALPLLGGAPNVWNSAMLVYQALLLAGYAYAHWLGRLTVRRQALVHVAVLALAATTLPVTLANLPPPAPGQEALWVPLLLLASIGPVFFAVSAQAPLMQRWFAASAGAGAPWALYAASNLGSFAGLIAYPLLAEPELTVREQSWAWSAGYAVLLALVLACAWARRDVIPSSAGKAVPAAPVPAGRIALWLALAAVPSGLMLSTTTHLTTDIFAAPLLWVIPLGLYLLSFVVAFADRRGLARVVTKIAPTVVLVAGSYAMLATPDGAFGGAVGAGLLLFCIATALHTRLYELRPEPAQLTHFYLVLSAGGVLGGLFTALVAPLTFDWVWEHPLLVLAGAALMPLPELLRWRHMDGLEPGMARFAMVILTALALFLDLMLSDYAAYPGNELNAAVLTVFIAGVGIVVMGWRGAFILVLAATMVAQGGQWTIRSSLAGERTRSYFGIYGVRDYPDQRLRILSHGTTLHGQQSLDPAHKDEALSYYGPTSGASLLLDAAPANARIGVVGLGTGSLACKARSGQHWTFFEIDPVVLGFSQSGKFTFLRDCTPDARIRIGDARLELAKAPPASFDILVIDAFSSDAIPVHLLTREALQVYERALSPEGVLLVHISNRYIDLGPIVAAHARDLKLAARSRFDRPVDPRFVVSRWIALSRDPRRIEALAQRTPHAPWEPLEPPARRAWTDDFASILPHVRWSTMTGP